MGLGKLFSGWKAVFRSVPLLAFVAASAAIGQSGIVGPVPIDRFTLSPGGVDLRSGVFTYNHTDLSIGAAGTSSGISLVRSTDNGKPHVERFAQFSHNWEIFVYDSFVTGGGLKVGGSGPIQISVTAQGRSMSFRSDLPRNYYGDLGPPINPSNAKISRVQSGTSYYYLYTAPDGTVITFNPMTFNTTTSARCNQDNGNCAYASQMVLPDGTQYDFSYDNIGTINSRLRRVVSNTGFALIFEYTTSGSQPYISKACALNLAVASLPSGYTCPAGAISASYAYSGNFMTQMTDPSGSVWNFGNTYIDGSSDYTLSLFKPGSATPYLVNTYQQSYSDSYFRVVKKQVFTPGTTYNYNFSVISQGDFNPGSDDVAGGDYTYEGKIVSASYGGYRPPKLYPDRTTYITPKPERLVDELGRVYTGDYCMPYPNGQGCRPTALQVLTDPSGIKTYYSYDSKLNVIQMVTKAKPGSGLADIVQSATYSCSNLKACAKPTSVTDANGNVTTTTYSFDHGGVLTQTLPAVNGINPVTRYAYAQHYAWLKAAGSGYVQATTPVWLLSEERTCKATATVGNACAGGAADEVVTTYEYQVGSASVGSNLLLKSKVVTADGASLRTCFGYDALGRKVSETAPRAGLTSCS